MYSRSEKRTTQRKHNFANSTAAMVLAFLRCSAILARRRWTKAKVVAGRCAIDVRETVRCGVFRRDEIRCRIKQARGSFRTMQKIFTRRHLRTPLRLIAVMLRVQHCFMALWLGRSPTPCIKEYRHLRCEPLYCRILKIPWTTNQEILQRLSKQTMVLKTIKS